MSGEFVRVALDTDSVTKSRGQLRSIVPFYFFSIHLNLIFLLMAGNFPWTHRLFPNSLRRHQTGKKNERSTYMIGHLFMDVIRGELADYGAALLIFSCLLWCFLIWNNKQNQTPTLGRRRSVCCLLRSLSGLNLYNEIFKSKSLASPIS
jgi:hypothetical protein